MSDKKECYSPVYGCTIFNDKYEDDDRKVTDYEVLSSLSKSLKIKALFNECGYTPVNTVENHVC